ncbi:hypothetical protein [Nitrolancea hollandica]|nr:hypothetical protein [Nitrolancea hollandica]
MADLPSHARCVDPRGAGFTPTNVRFVPARVLNVPSIALLYPT